jgi:hypothetical protein
VSLTLNFGHHFRLHVQGEGNKVDRTSSGNFPMLHIKAARTINHLFRAMTISQMQQRCHQAIYRSTAVSLFFAHHVREVAAARNRWLMVQVLAASFQSFYIGLLSLNRTKRKHCMHTEHAVAIIFIIFCHGKEHPCSLVYKLAIE